MDSMWLFVFQYWMLNMRSWIILDIFFFLCLFYFFFLILFHFDCMVFLSNIRFGLSVIHVGYELYELFSFCSFFSFVRKMKINRDIISAQPENINGLVSSGKHELGQTHFHIQIKSVWYRWVHWRVYSVQCTQSKRQNRTEAEYHDIIHIWRYHDVLLYTVHCTHDKVENWFFSTTRGSETNDWEKNTEQKNNNNKQNETYTPITNWNLMTMSHRVESFNAVSVGIAFFEKKKP